MSYLDKMSSIFDKNFFDDIHIDIYVAGNSIEGESILVVMKSNDVVLHSMIIDSFKGLEGKNPLIPILESFELERLDLVVWTHPHEDHTHGFNDILDAFKSRIVEIVIPVKMNGNEKKYRGEVKEVFAKINDINRKNIKDKSLELITETQSDHYIVDKERIKLTKSDEDLEFSIFSVSPMSNIARNRSIDLKYKHLNDFSIALYYQVGDFILFLSGDVENLTINNLRTNTLRKMALPNVIKIPHHGSEGSTKFIDFYEETNDFKELSVNISTTTSYLDHDLPRESVLKRYNRISDKVYRIDSEKVDDAIIQIRVDAVRRTIRIYDNKNFELYKP